MKLVILIAIPFLLLSGASIGAQTRFAKDNAEIAAVISSGEVSRIALYDDRIRSVTGVPAGFSLEHDGATGDVFLIPEDFGALAEGFINLFIISEAGYTYQLLLQLRDIPSEQILIRNPAAKSADVPRDAPRHEQIAALLRAAIAGEPLKGYRRLGVALGEYALLPNFLSSEVWQGAHFRAVLMTRIGEADDITAEALAGHYAGAWMSADGGRAIIVMEARDDEAF